MTCSRMTKCGGDVCRLGSCATEKDCKGRDQLGSATGPTRRTFPMFAASVHNWWRTLHCMLTRTQHMAVAGM